VHTLPTHTVKTFEEYAQNIFLPHVSKRLGDSERVDVVFDRYVDGSLKSDTRKSRGSGQKVVVTASTTIPKIFSQFLMVDENKSQLFHYLAETVSEMKIDSEKLVICTHEETLKHAPSHRQLNIQDISPSSHEEADARLLTHVKHAVLNGHKKVMVMTVDSDVYIIALFAFRQLHLMGL